MTTNLNGLSYLLGRLVSAEQRIRAAVAARRAVDPHPDDPFRGLYLSEEVLDSLLEVRRGPFTAPDFGAADPHSRLTGLATLAELSELDTELLLLAMAPDVDSRFEQFYGYLNDDVTRRRASVGLALRLCGLPEAAATGRARLDRSGPLIKLGLLDVTDTDRPFLSRTLRVPDRVVAHLLGDDSMDPALPAELVHAGEVHASPGTQMLRRVLTAGSRLVYLREPAAASGADLATAALGEIGKPALQVDLGRLLTGPDSLEASRGLVREALLADAGIIAGPVGEGDPGEVLAILTSAPVPVLLYGGDGWDPRWGNQLPLQLDVEPLRPEQRATLWRNLLNGKSEPGVDAASACAHFVLSAPQVRRAAAAAVMVATSQGTLVGTAQLRDGARSQNSSGLERLARRIAPTVGWDDLVLPSAVLSPLHELSARARHRDQVLDTWNMRPGGGRGRGVTGLFAGDSGTGKTMSAEVIAHQLGMDLYTVNLATVVDKYIGETEKNLERIFTEAAGVNGVLLFDEADAIFGKRSEVRDARDRYANVESAYLLQRMETFDGFAILATNLRANLDEAFTRRLDVVVDFPLPDEEHRLLLWDRCLGSRLPRGDDLNLEFLAGAFELAGGHIRSAVVTAAYLAAADGRPVGMRDTVGAVAREYQKLGRLCLEREFGPYMELLA